MRSWPIRLQTPPDRNSQIGNIDRQFAFANSLKAKYESTETF